MYLTLAKEKLKRQELELSAKYRGVLVQEFTKEELVKICNIFAQQWSKALELNNALLEVRHAKV